MKNFNTEINGTGTKTSAVRINYLRTLIRWESLKKIDNLASQVTGMTNSHLTYIKMGLLT